MILPLRPASSGHTDLEPIHQILQLTGKSRQALSAQLYLAAAISYLIRLIIYIADITCYVGNDHGSLGHILIDFSNTL
jgi:hypothetical protein